MTATWTERFPRVRGYYHLRRHGVPDSLALVLNPSETVPGKDVGYIFELDDRSTLGFHPTCIRHDSEPSGLWYGPLPPAPPSQ